MIPVNFIYVGLLINIVLSAWYIKSIIWGNTKPNLVSWFIWSFAPLTGFFLQLKAGAGLAASGIFIGGIFPLATLIICLFRKNSYWKISAFDIFCGSLSVIALILYVVTKNVGLSIIFAILSDALAYIPTLSKSWKFPETESASTYAGGIINNIFALLIIKNWSFAIYSFPAYIVLINIVTVALIHRKKIFKTI